MLEYGYYNMDCMQGMKDFPDGYFDLAIVDPPYGIKENGKRTVHGQSWQRRKRIHRLRAAT